MIRKLKNHEYANCFVEITDNNDIYFWSYRTLMAEIIHDEHGLSWLHINGLYSATSRRQLSWFMKDYTRLDYQTAKQIYENNAWLCLETGEVVDNV